MLSKILNGPAGTAAALFQWPRVGAPPLAWGGETGKPDAADGQAARDARRIAELEQQIERRAREGRENGYREGEASGRAQAAAAVQPVLDRLARAIQEIAELRPQILRDSTAELVDLSLAVARRILHRELSVDPAALEGLVAGSLQKVAGQEIGRIRIHPELEAGVRQALARQGRGGLALVADATLERGGILIETQRGKLDASIETQLGEIGRGLADRLEK